MIAEIEEAIIARIEEKVVLAEGQISVSTFLDSGSLEKITSATYRQTVSGDVSMIFRGISTAGQRRKAVYPILEGIEAALLDQKLGLDIKPLRLKSFRNVTPDEYREQGLLVYNLEVETAYHLRRLDEEEVDDLLRVGLNYYLQDPVDDAVADASDLVGEPLPEPEL